MIELNKIYNIDCLLGMKDIEDKTIDFICCDPPYGQTSQDWDKIIDFKSLWLEYKRIIKNNGVICIFGQEPYSSYVRLSNIEDYKYDWYWVKERLTNVFQVKRRPGKVVETISVFYKDQCKYFPQKTTYDGVLRTNKIKDGKLGKLVDNNENKPNEYKDDRTRFPTQILNFNRDILTSNLHPTQKPLALLEYLVKTYTEENDIVLDNCAGSGTTLIAAENLKRKWIGIEKEEKYCEVIKKRFIDNNIQIL